jgi:glycosyltransferase involved in cell wall biosynthesis
MRLLFVTQALDLDDPVLSTYHDWAAALAGRVESMEAICLKEGRHALPGNIRIHSLGKEHGKQSRIRYALRFLRLSWKLRNEYDAVLVHMNQEYVLISGWLWKMLGKRVYLWRNHYAGSVFTDSAASFCTNVFYTSMHSYTARYKKAVRMPVGVNLDRFRAHASVLRTPHSILFFARMSPSKRPELLVEALALLKEREVPFTASFYGSPLPEDLPYYEKVQGLVAEKGLLDSVTFFPGVVNEEALRVFQSHEIFVNCSPSGMFDKMLFEAAASGCVVLAVSEDFADLFGRQYQFDAAPAALAKRLEESLNTDAAARAGSLQKMQDIASKQGLSELALRLVEAMR